MMSLTVRHYAVLASLAQEPRSGYDITQWFAFVTKHFCAFGHSSIYPTLADLERRGLVTFTEMSSEQGPTRKVYRLTTEGSRALLDWVAEPAADAEVRDEQLLKALCYGFIPAERAAELLRLARAHHAERQAHYEQIVTAAAAAMAAPDAKLSAAALGRWLTARRGVSVQESYVAWCDEALAAIRDFVHRVGSEQSLTLAGEVPGNSAALRARYEDGRQVDNGEDQDEGME